LGINEIVFRGHTHSVFATEISARAKYMFRGSGMLILQGLNRTCTGKFSPDIWMQDKTALECLRRTDNANKAIKNP